MVWPFMSLSIDKVLRGSCKSCSFKVFYRPVGWGNGVIVAYHGLEFVCTRLTHPLYYEWESYHFGWLMLCYLSSPVKVSPYFLHYITLGALHRLGPESRNRSLLNCSITSLSTPCSKCCFRWMKVRAEFICFLIPEERSYTYCLKSRSFI